MILYVNGDSHTAAAEAVNPHAFAEDDPLLFHLGRQPHPDNLAASWGKQLADRLGYTLYCDAESASSNDRIIRTTKQYLAKNKPDLVIIQWSTWEREEWIIKGEHFQVNASGIDHVPANHQNYYKNYIANIDWQSKTFSAHQRIWDFHKLLLKQNIPHVFFNGNTSFETVVQRFDWGSSFIDPYEQHGTYHSQLNKLFSTVNPDSYHYGPEAHMHWANTLYQYLVDNHLV
jgi:hypothetical protein